MCNALTCANCGHVFRFFLFFFTENVNDEQLGELFQ